MNHGQLSMIRTQSHALFANRRQNADGLDPQMGQKQVWKVFYEKLLNLLIYLAHTPGRGCANLSQNVY